MCLKGQNSLYYILRCRCTRSLFGGSCDSPSYGGQEHCCETSCVDDQRWRYGILPQRPAALVVDGFALDRRRRIGTAFPLFSYLCGGFFQLRPCHIVLSSNLT